MTCPTCQVARRSLENEKKEIEKMKLFEPDVSAEVRELFEHLSKTYDWFSVYVL